MQCDTSSCLCRFHFVGATFGPQEFIRNLTHFLSYSTSVILLLRKIFTCPSGKLSTEFTSPIAKSTSPGLSDTTFFARCLIIQMLAKFFGVEFEKDCIKVQKKKKESCCLLFPSSTKRELRPFHVVVVQRRQRNVQKSVMNVQSCCFACHV